VTVGDLMEILATHDPAKQLALYDADGDPDEIYDVDSYEDAVVLVSFSVSRPGGTR
jgi:hypothetical protein